MDGRHVDECKEENVWLVFPRLKTFLNQQRRGALQFEQPRI